MALRYLDRFQLGEFHRLIGNAYIVGAVSRLCRVFVDIRADGFCLYACIGEQAPTAFAAGGKNDWAAGHCWSCL